MVSTERARSIVVPGNHDGVHLGHVALLARARAAASRLGASRVVALTFDPHPLALLSPERAPRALTSIERRRELLLRAGADEVAVVRFDERFAQLDADAFVERELVERFSAAAVVVGADFRFGRGRSGDPDYLRALGARLGFEVEVLDAVACGEVPRVSSSAIRERLFAGDAETAARLLGRPHELEGTVARGQRRGRTIGYPTANLADVRVLAPADGVYAVVARVLVNGRASDEEPVAAGMMNIGVRPTLRAGRSIEVHLFDVARDLYGRVLRVGVLTRLRDERRFASPEALVEQLREDERLARSIATPAIADARLLA